MRAPTGPCPPPHPGLPPLRWQTWVFSSSKIGLAAQTAHAQGVARHGREAAGAGGLEPLRAAAAGPSCAPPAGADVSVGRPAHSRALSQPVRDSAACAAAACRHSSAAGAGARTLAAALQLQALALGPGQADAGADGGVGARQADHAVQVQAGHRAAPRQQPRGLLRAAPQHLRMADIHARRADRTLNQLAPVLGSAAACSASVTRSLQGGMAACITTSPRRWGARSHRAPACTAGQAHALGLGRGRAHRERKLLVLGDGLLRAHVVQPRGAQQAEVGRGARVQPHARAPVLGARGRQCLHSVPACAISGSRALGAPLP